MLDKLSLSEQIDVIVSASIIIEHPVQSYDGLLLIHPYYKHKRVAEFLYKQAIKKAEANNIYTRDKMLAVLEDRGVINQEYYDKEAMLVKRIKSNRILLSKMKFAKDKIKKLEDTIKKLEDELSKLTSVKEQFLSNTSDSLAMMEKLNYLVWAATYNLSETRVWDTYDSFMHEQDLEFKNNIFYSVIPFLFGFDMKQLRFIARSSEWRVRYSAYLKGYFPLFSRDPEDYTKDQLGLMHWSNYYQSIYEMLPDDRPTEDIIEDDEALDEYMNEYFKQVEQEQKINKARNKGSDAFDKEEVEYDKVQPKGDGPVIHEGRRKR